MPALRVDNAGLLTLTWFNATTVFKNVLGVNVPAGKVIDQTVANALDTAIKGGFTSSALISKISPTVSLSSVGIRDIRTTNNAEFIGSGAAVAGTGTGDPLPLQNATVVTLRTARAGRSFRGRVYLSGFTETENTTSGAVNSASNVAAVAFITSIQTALSNNGMNLAIVSRPAEKVTTTVETTHADGTTSTIVHTTGPRAGGTQNVTLIQSRNAIWDTQRKRAAAGSGSSLFLNSEVIQQEVTPI